MRKMIIGIVVLLLIIIGSFFYFTGNVVLEDDVAQEEEIAEAKPSITIATADFPPFKFLEDGEVVGLDTEIILAVFDRMGYEVTIEMLPFKRADRATRNGDYAAYYTFTYSENRGEDYLFTDPISAVQDVFFYDTYRLSDPNVQKISDWETLNFLEGLEVGVSENYNYAPEFMKLWRPSGFPQWNPDEEGFVRIFNPHEISSEANEKQHLINLVEAKIHTFISDVSVGNYYREQDLERFGSIIFAKKPPGEIRTFHMGLSKKWRGPNGEEPEDLLDEFNFELAKFIEEGGRLPIYEKYGFVSPFIPKTNEIRGDDE